MQISSPAFEHNQHIPSVYTCDGAGINPPLVISDVPKESKSLVLLMEDPDVPKELRPDGMWDHWVVYNIPPTVTTIEEGKAPEGLIGLHTGGKSEYYPACPPNGEHRYFFKLFALDDVLAFEDAGIVTKKMVESAMAGHIVAHAELVGFYSRS